MTGRIERKDDVCHAIGENPAEQGSKTGGYGPIALTGSAFIGPDTEEIAQTLAQNFGACRGGEGSKHGAIDPEGETMNVGRTQVWQAIEECTVYWVIWETSAMATSGDG